jgi:hypothetical protein
MRPQTDLQILLTAVIIIINDSQTNPPDPAGVSHKLICEVKLSEGQEGTTLINRAICALSGPCLVSFRYCPSLEASRWAQLGPSTLTCSGPSRDRLSNVYSRVLWNWDDCRGPSWSFLRHWSCVNFFSPEAWKRAPLKGQGVSVQKLSSNLFNINKWSKAQGPRKGDLFQLTRDEPHNGELGSSGWEESLKITGETLQS